MRFNEHVVQIDFCGIPLVGNLLNGYVIGLTGEGAEICARLATEDLEPELIASVNKMLLEHLEKGSFFDDEPPESEDRSGVVAAYLHVTQRCNLNCAGCYSDDEGRNVLADASLADIDHALDELASAGVKKLVISGGEPFLRKDLPEIVRHAKEACGIQSVTVLSNGTCIRDDVLERMQPFVDCVSVSFDGWSADCIAYIREEQRFDELVAAIRRIQAAGIPAHMIPTVHGKNIDELSRYIALSKELGVTMNFSLLSCEPHDAVLGALLPEEAELRQLGRSLLEVAEHSQSLAMDAPIGVNLNVKMNCGAGFRELSIAADGTIYPCHMLHYPQFAMGNAFEGSVVDALESDASNMFRSLRVEEHEGCSSCRHMHLCGGGCRARSMFASRTLHARDSYCAMIHEFYDCLGASMKASLERGAQ